MHRKKKTLSPRIWAPGNPASSESQNPSRPGTRLVGSVGVFRPELATSAKSSESGLLVDMSEELETVRPGIDGRSRGERYGDLRERAKLAIVPSSLLISSLVELEMDSRRGRLRGPFGQYLWCCVIRRQRRCMNKGWTDVISHTGSGEGW